VSELLKIRPYGLVDGDNPLSDAPDGALEQAENVIISANGVVTPVDGFEATGEQLPSGTFKQLHVSLGGKRYGITGGTLYEISTSSPVTIGSSFSNTQYDQPPRFLSAHSDMDPVFCGAVRSTRLVASDSYMRFRVPIPVTMVAPSGWTTTGTWMSPNRAVAYRATIVRRYANGKVVESPPSAPYIFRTHFYVTASGGGGGTLSFSRPHGLVNGNVVGDAPSGGLTSGTVNVVTNAYRVTLSGSTLPAGSLEVFVGGSVFTNPTVTVRAPYWTEPNTSAPITLVRIYRTESVLGAWETPGTGYYLVGEVTPTTWGPDYTEVVFTDTTTDTDVLAGTPAPFGALSILQDSPLEQLDLVGTPDLTADIALWDSRLWSAAYTPDPVRVVDLLGTASSPTVGSLVSGDTVTIDGYLMTAAGEGAALTSAVFPVAVSGTAEINLETTVYNLMTSLSLRPVSSNFSWPFIYPISNGGFAIRGSRAFSITVASSDPTAFNPAMTGTIPADASLNGLAPSKPDEFEVSLPTTWLLVGSASDRIRRIYPWRDRLIVFKEQEGVFVVYPIGGGLYAVSGPTCSGRLVATEAVAVLGDYLYAWTHIGVLRIDSSGAGASVSDDISEALSALTTPSMVGRTNLLQSMLTFNAVRGAAQSARMLSDEAEQTITLWMPTPASSGAYVPLTTGYVYNTTTGRWSTRADVTVACAAQDPITGRPWVIANDSAGDALAVIPRAVDDPFRFSGPSSEASYTVSGDTITNGSTDMKAGDAFVQGVNIGYVTATDGAGVLTLTPGHGLTTGAMTYYPAIQATIAFQPFYLNDPGTQKLVSDATVFMSPDSSGEPQAAFVSERAPDEVFTEGPADGYGMNGYGDGYYSGQFRAGVTFQANARTGNVRAPSIIIRFCRAFSDWKFWGLGVNITKGLERSRG